MIVLSESFFLEQFREHLERRSIDLPVESREPIGLYFYLLDQVNKLTNLTGYKDVDDYIDFHLVDTMKILDIIHPHEGASLTDVGTGAGIPGLIIGILRPDINVNLIETIAKKTRFLNFAVEQISLKNCKVIKNRAEEMALDFLWRERSDICVARALGSFSNTLELTAGFVRKGGIIALPRGLDDEIDENAPCINELGCVLDKKVEYQIPRRKRFQVVLLKKVENLQPKYPRKPGQIRKRPL